MSEVDGKATGWRAHYQGGKWVAEQGKAGGGRRKRS